MKTKDLIKARHNDVYHVNDQERAALKRSAEDDRILFPSVGQVAMLKQRIVESGGLDVQIVATDPYEGHVAQNFAGESYSKTEEQKCGSLSSSFIRHHDWASKYHGVTFDLNDFMEMVRANAQGEFMLVVTGQPKHRILREFLEKQRYVQELPLSFLWLAPARTLIFTDMAAQSVS